MGRGSRQRRGMRNVEEKITSTDLRLWSMRVEEGTT